MGSPNWSNQTIWTGDNLPILRGMNSECVDLIYLDPPFNSNANYAAPIGSKAAGAEFKDTWGLDDINLAWHGEIKHEYPGLYALLTATREINGDSMMSYLIYMAIRAMEMRRLLKPTGSIYLHCDPTASHYLKLLMDSIYGKGLFRNEVVWCYRKWSVSAGQFARNHDVILVYSKTQRNRFNTQYLPVSPGTFKRWKGQRQQAVFKDGIRQAAAIEAKAQSACPDWWQISVLNPNAKERVGYPTQKPLALLDRIIEASSNEGDVVLDPFCGCATACISAESLGRQWVGIDIAPRAAELVKLRLKQMRYWPRPLNHRTDTPTRTDLGRIVPYNSSQNRKYLYGEQGGYCNGCEGHFEARHLEVDHIIPKSKGGTDHISNLQLLCGSCNRLKGKKSQADLLVLLTDKGWIKRRKIA